MEMQGYFTNKGLALSAKLLTGDTLRITRVAAGSGETQNPMQATSLPQSKQELAVNTPTRSGNTVTVPATLAAAAADEDYTLRELGVYAQDPNEGEILYKLYRLDEPVDITAGSRLVLRFYLEETVAQDLSVTVDCAPAGLITEADFAPVRERVESVEAGKRSVHLDISDAQAYLDALPRMLTETVVLNVTGTTDASLKIAGFYGSGSIDIRAASLGDCTIRNLVTVSDCSTPVYLYRLQMETPGGDSVNNGLIDISDCSRVYVQACALLGERGGPQKGIRAADNSHVVAEEVQISGFSTAVFAARCSVISMYNSAASDFHDNTTGGHVWRGGMILLAGNTPQLLGGSANIKDGGIIADKNGTLI